MSKDQKPLLNYPRSCLFILILLIQVFILYYSNHRPPSLSTASPPVTTVITTVTTTAPPPQPPPIATNNTCKSGKFYIYNLPQIFNSEIYSNCDKINPWRSQCQALSNNGFGPKAIGINHIIPKNLSDTWHFTDQFTSEIIFHNRLKHHPCRTLVSDTATAYYIPFYAGLAVGKYLWYNYTFEDRDRHCKLMLQWLRSNSKHFNKSNGWDHFLIMGRITWDFRRSMDKDWGSKCIFMDPMKNITRLLIEKDPWDSFDIGIPYPTGFHPRTRSELESWQDFVRTRVRKYLFCFAGGTRKKFVNDFRGVLLDQCRLSNGSCRVVDCAGTRCSNGKTEILETFLDSDFCLQPRGDSFTRRSIFDCMVAGSIPVFFWRRSAYMQYEWFLPGEPESYSVFIHRDEVKNGTLVKSVLEKFSKEEVKKMRDKVVEFIPRFIYSKPNQGLISIKDAVDVAVDGVLKRIKEKKGEFN